MSTPSFPHAYLFKEVSPRTAARKARERICKHWGCTRLSREGSRDCETCHSRKFRINNPARDAFNEVKKSARKRGIDFSLTFAQFKEFDRQTGYVEVKGKGQEDLGVDRIDPTRGYEFDNIRALTYQENCRRRLNGVTDPAQPVAQALADAYGHGIWQRCRNKANDTLVLVEVLLAQRDGGFDPLLEDDDEVPF